MAEVILKPGKERSLQRRHPWIYAGSVARTQGRMGNGDTVTVVDDEHRPLARAAWSPHSQIRARVWSFAPDAVIDHAFFKRMVAASVARRSRHPDLCEQEGLRLIHGESDGLPGVIADRYGAVVVLQLTSAGADKWRGAIIDALVQATGCAAIYERSDSEVRAREGLEPVSGLVHGELPERVVIFKHALRGGIIPVVSFLDPAFAGLLLATCVVGRPSPFIGGIPVSSTVVSIGATLRARSREITASRASLILGLRRTAVCKRASGHSSTSAPAGTVVVAAEPLPVK